MHTVALHKNVKTVLPFSEWNERKRRHEEKVDSLIGDYLNRRSRQLKQPVMDFLFEYYAFRPSALKKWSPGLGVALEVEDFSSLPQISELKAEGGIAWINLSLLPEKRLRSVQWILTTLKNTRQARPSFGCFGMHEWAMVYKAEKPRHNQVPLRMEPDELAAFVDSRPLVCTHFDAYRFFTPQAVPLNKHVLSRERFSEMEQPGCIHSNMDLYKWAFKLYPWISSNLILEAFELACEARTIDMKASPYDLRDHGLEPIKIETESGRLKYKLAQETIFEKGKPIRDNLIHSYESLLRLVGSITPEN